MRNTLVLSLALALTFPLAASDTHAGLDRATKCEAGKLGEAGKYAKCLLKARAKARKKGVEAATEKCDAKFEAKWAKHEDKAGGECPSNLDRDTIKAEIAEQAGVIAGCVAGGECEAGCIGDLGTCATDLADEQDAHTTTQASLNVCTADLAAVPAPASVAEIHSRTLSIVNSVAVNECKAECEVGFPPPSDTVWDCITGCYLFAQSFMSVQGSYDFDGVCE